MNTEQFFVADLAPENALVSNKELLESNYRLGANANIEHCNIRMHIAERPAAIDYIDLCKKSGITISPEMQLLHDRFDLWMVKYVIGVIDNSHSCNLIDFGFKTKYDKSVSIQSMLPETKYVKRAFTGGFISDVGLSANGEAHLEDTEIKIQPIQLALGVGVKLGVNGNISLRISIPTLTPKIVSIGQNSNYGEWTVSREDKLLAGDQVFIQTLLTDKNIERIPMQAQVYCTIRKLGVINSRRVSEWVPIEVALR